MFLRCERVAFTAKYATIGNNNTSNADKINISIVLLLKLYPDRVQPFECCTNIKAQHRQQSEMKITTDFKMAFNFNAGLISSSASSKVTSGILSYSPHE